MNFALSFYIKNTNSIFKYSFIFLKSEIDIVVELLKLLDVIRCIPLCLIRKEKQKTELLKELNIYMFLLQVAALESLSDIVKEINKTIIPLLEGYELSDVNNASSMLPLLGNFICGRDIAVFSLTQQTDYVTPDNAEENIESDDEEVLSGKYADESEFFHLCRVFGINDGDIFDVDKHDKQ